MLAFTDAGGDFVARFGCFREDFENDRRAGGWRTAALAVPEVFDVGEAFDGYYAISARAHGDPLESITEGQWCSLLPWGEFLLAVDRDAPDRRTHGWRQKTDRLNSR